MSRLLFRRSFGKIILYSGNDIVGSWDAHNDTTSSSNGLWPNGKYKWSHFNSHMEEGLLPGAYLGAFGGLGIHVFSVKGRSGLGVHAGRTWGQPDVLGGKTLGCIRVTAPAMLKINETHRKDPLKEIELSS